MKAKETAIRFVHRKTPEPQYDEHTLATAGDLPDDDQADAIRRMEEAEDRADVYASALADRLQEVAYWADRSW